MDIQDLISPKIEVEFKGEKYMVDDFTVGESDITELAFQSKDRILSAEYRKKLIKLLFKKLFPTAKDTDLDKIAHKHIEDIMPVFHILNGTEEKMKEVVEAKMKENLAETKSE